MKPAKMLRAALVPNNAVSLVPFIQLNQSSLGFMSFKKVQAPNRQMGTLRI